MDNLGSVLNSLVLVGVVAALAPVIVALLPGPRVPQLVVLILAALGLVRAFVPVALGLTTTALGTLLPILREHDLLAGQFGRYVLAAGAVGELLPILGIALFLGTQSQFVAILSVASVGVLALVLSFAPRLARGNRIGRIVKEGEHATTRPGGPRSANRPTSSWRTPPGRPRSRPTSRPSSPPGPICSGGWHDTARPRLLESARRRTPAPRSSRRSGALSRTDPGPPQRHAPACDVRRGTSPPPW